MTGKVIPDEAVEAAVWVVIAGQKHGADPVITARAALEAAAPHMQRTVTMVEELNSLPYGAVVLDASRSAATKLDTVYWEVAGFASHFRVEAIELPATVLHEPEGSL